MSVFADLDDSRIKLSFPYDPDTVRRVKGVYGARFVPRDKGGPHWTVPLSLDAARSLREALGSDLKISRELKSWAQREVRRADRLEGLSKSPDAELEVLKDRLPELYQTLHPFQRSGAKFIAESYNPLIADQPGLGKTLQIIAGIFEEGSEIGLNLVVAPRTSLNTVWAKELRKWQHEPVIVLSRSTKKAAQELERFVEQVGIGWVIVNPEKINLRSQWDTSGCERHDGTEKADERKRCPNCKKEDVFLLPAVQGLVWDRLIVDECHKNAVRNPKTKSSKAIKKIKADKRIAASGTPMTNKVIDMWGVLNFLEPKVFTSKWRWAKEWLHTYHNGFGWVICNGTKCNMCEGGIRAGLAEDFFQSISPYILRRKKEEVLPELPPKRHVDRWCSMTDSQTKQYEKFAADAEVIINQERVSASVVVAELTRLKQFSISRQDVQKDEEGNLKLIPTMDGGKIEQLEELLEERGIFDHEPEEKVVIFSQFAQVIKMIQSWLATEKDVECLRITGDVKDRDRDEAQRLFQDPNGPSVIAVTTTAGGVAITLDAADTVVFMDETWSPTDMEQAEDRVHRASRMHNVTIYTLRTEGTIDETIMEVVDVKGGVHDYILDVRRQLRLR